MTVEEASVSEKKASNSEVSSEAERSSSRLLHLFLLATLPPTLIVALDEVAISYGNRNHCNRSRPLAVNVS